MSESEQSTLCDPEETRPPHPEGACVNWDECGNYPPGHPETNNKMCDDCLDASRARGRGHDLGDD